MMDALMRQRVAAAQSTTFAQNVAHASDKDLDPAQPIVASKPILVPVAFGGLIDKITILQIKSEKMKEPAKLANVRRELDLLLEAVPRIATENAGLDTLTAELKQVNETLWCIEDEIRQCEHTGDFGSRFIALARSVYRNNDKRAEIKRRINLLTGSAILEEKSYESY